MTNQVIETNNVYVIPEAPGKLLVRALSTIIKILPSNLPANHPFFPLLYLMLGGHVSTIEIGRIDTIRQPQSIDPIKTGLNEISFLDIQILTNQAEGHKIIAPTEMPDSEIHKPSVDTTGPGMQQANGVKQHPALAANQFAGVNPDGKQATLPSDMTLEEAERALGELDLTASPTLTKQLGNEPPAPAPAATPTPSPFK